MLISKENTKNFLGACAIVALTMGMGTATVHAYDPTGQAGSPPAAGAAIEEQQLHSFVQAYRALGELNPQAMSQEELQQAQVGIIQENGLTIEQYQQINQMAQTDPEVNRRVIELMQ